MSKDTTVEMIDFARQLRAIDVYLTEISVQHGEHYDPRLTDRSKTFSRFNWGNQQLSVLIKKTDNPSDRKNFILRFRLDTVTTIGLGPRIAEGTEIPAEKILGTIAINFVTEYFTTIDPKTISADTIQEIGRSKVLDDIWPYWRESLQSLAARAKFPIPALPMLKSIPNAAVARATKKITPDKPNRDNVPT